jgi:hypothetical protein
MNRQQRRAEKRAGQTPQVDRDAAAMIAMASRIAELDDEGRAIAREAAATRLASLPLTPAERAGAERRIVIIHALVESMVEAKRGGR